jgi:PrtD family type I secretion system ABC transporter
MKEFLRKWKKYFVCAGVLSCLINFLQLTSSFYMFTIYGAIITSHSETSLYTVTIVALYALVHLAVFTNLRAKLLRTAGLDLDATLSERVIGEMIKGGSGPVKKTYQQGYSDISVLNSYFNSQGLYALFDVPFAPFYLVVIYFLHPVLGVVATCGTILAVGMILLQDRLTRKRILTANVDNNTNRHFIDTMLRNAEVVNAMGMAGNIYNRFEKTNRSVVVNQTVASRYAGMTQSGLKSFQISMNVFIFGISAYYVLQGEFDPAGMIVASVIMGRALGPILMTVRNAKSTVNAREAYNRLHGFCAFLDARPEKMSLPKPTGQINVDHLFFGISGKLILKDVSFHLEPGDFLGLIGPNGAGKTTLSRILLGIWPVGAGNVRLDGVEMFAWDQDELGEHVGYLPQEIELFSGTIAENIARLGSVDQDKVIEAAKAADIHDFIVNMLPEGYDTRIYGEEGIVFSGGQKQRIGLARALYNDPVLLILDEPNSNLDEQAEAKLLATLNRLRAEQKTTCVVITHTMSLLDVANKVLMLDNGMVGLFGPKNEVLEKLAKARTNQRQAG